MSIKGLENNVIGDAMETIAILAVDIAAGLPFIGSGFEAVAKRWDRDLDISRNQAEALYNKSQKIVNQLDLRNLSIAERQSEIRNALQKHSDQLFSIIGGAVPVGNMYNNALHAHDSGTSELRRELSSLEQEYRSNHDKIAKATDDANNAVKTMADIDAEKSRGLGDRFVKSERR